MYGQDILRIAVDLLFMVAVPAIAGTGVGEPAFTVAVVDALFTARADFDAVAGTAGIDAGAISRDRKFLDIA